MIRLLQTVFWFSLLAFIAWDWRLSGPVDPYAEPPAIAIGSGQKSAGGHCSNATK